MVLRIPIAVSAALLSLMCGPAFAAETDGTRWLISAIDAQPPIGEPEIVFLDDGGISGSTGCNRFNVSAVVESGTLRIEGPIATTRMACPGAGLTDQEDRILEALQGELLIRFDPFASALELSNDDITIRLTKPKD